MRGGPAPAKFAGEEDMPEYDYEKVVNIIRETVAAKLPASTTVAVASRGDDDLLQLGPRTGWHLPAEEDGSSWGGHPTDSADAIQRLEAAREKGAEYFLLPEPQFWWREHYADFDAHLRRRHQLVWEGEDCVIYQLLAPPPVRLEMLTRLRWLTDRVFLHKDLVFWNQLSNDDVCELGEDCFRLYKGKSLLDVYSEFWKTHDDLVVRNLLEIGIWAGGSVAFWFEFFQPDKHVAVDLMQRKDSEYFNRYRHRFGIEERLRTFWGVNQQDARQLSAVVDAEFTGPLDLVIDDASHLYGPTRGSFETLFPRLRPGGLFLIEDWAWEHWPTFNGPDHFWARERGLTDLVFELTQIVGTRGGAIKNLFIGQGFVAVERGDVVLPQEGFRLEDHIIRRPPPVLTDPSRERSTAGNGRASASVAASA
jgi:hypothetical protein